MKRAVGTGWNAYNTFSEGIDWMNIIYADYTIFPTLYLVFTKMNINVKIKITDNLNE